MRCDQRRELKKFLNGEQVTAMLKVIPIIGPYVSMTILQQDIKVVGLILIVQEPIATREVLHLTAIIMFEVKTVEDLV